MKNVCIHFVCIACELSVMINVCFLLSPLFLSSPTFITLCPSSDCLTCASCFIPPPHYYPVLFAVHTWCLCRDSHTRSVKITPYITLPPGYYLFPFITVTGTCLLFFAIYTVSVAAWCVVRLGKKCQGIYNVLYTLYPIIYFIIPLSKLDSNIKCAAHPG